jgi:hypothetical protein
MRHRPNLRKYERGRPHTPQRLCCCTRNLGGRLDFSIIDFLANCVCAPNVCGGTGRWPVHRRAAYATDRQSGGRSSADLSALERHAHQLQQAARLRIGASRGDNRDLETTHSVDPVVLDLRENQLLP